MDIKEVSAIIKLDKSLRDEVRKAEQKRDEIEQSIKSRVEKLHDEYYSDLDSVLSEYEAKKKGETSRRIAAQAEEYEKQLGALNAKYDAEKNVWLEHIVGAVTEV